MARFPTTTEEPLHWVGSSKKDLLAFPGDVVDDLGYALSVVQHGGRPPSATWKSEGPGVFELVGLRGALCEKRRRLRLRQSTRALVTCWWISASRTPMSGSCACNWRCGSTSCSLPVV